MAISSLDNRTLIKQVDQNNFLSHLLDCSEQIIEGFALGEETRVPALYAQAKQIVIIATGEMSPVAAALRDMATSYARVPIIILEDYVLPAWVTSDTLVIALDYYGTTEQVIGAYTEAAQRKARLLSVSLGGDIARESRRYRAPHIALAYGAPARVAFFYTLSCLVSLFRKLDLLEIKQATVNETSVLMRSLLDTIHPDVPQYQNNAKQLAEKIVSHKTILVASGPLRSIGEKWQTSMAATGKIIVTYSSLSQFNDTIINGLGYQTKPTDAPLVVMLQSKYDHSRNKLQQTLTYQVAHLQKVMYEQIFMHPSGSLFGEIMLAALFGEIVGYYCALLLHIDPSLVEATNYVREHLLQASIE